MLVCFGTLDELFEALTLVQTHKIEKIPVILYGKNWNGCIEWLEEITLLKYSNISKEDLDLFKLVDSPDEVLKIIDKHYKNQNFSPNF